MLAVPVFAKESSSLGRDVATSPQMGDASIRASARVHGFHTTADCAGIDWRENKFACGFPMYMGQPRSPFRLLTCIARRLKCDQAGTDKTLAFSWQPFRHHPPGSRDLFGPLDFNLAPLFRSGRDHSFEWSPEIFTTASRLHMTSTSIPAMGHYGRHATWVYVEHCIF